MEFYPGFFLCTRDREIARNANCFGVHGRLALPNIQFSDCGDFGNLGNSGNL
jgi:hypothetical protein